MYNLAATATRDNLSLVAVVLRAPTPTERVSNARNLLDYGFSNFEFYQTSTKDKVVQTVGVEKGIEKEVQLVFKEDSGTILKKGTGANVESRINIEENISAPIQAGDVLGKVEFYLDDKKIASSELVAKTSIEKVGVFSNFKYITKSWFTLLR